MDPIWLSASNYQENEEIQIVPPLLPFSSLLFRETHSHIHGDRKKERAVLACVMHKK
jgi:hypothetical protein